MIKLRDVYKTYFMGDNRVDALKGVNIQIMPEEMVAIMGPSGSGKSTAMNIIGLLDRPSAGHYELDGREVSTLSRDELAELRNLKLGFIFQSFFLLPRLSALQNVALPLTYRNIHRAESKEQCLHALKKVGMGQYAKHKPNELSGGQQQRVAIARALVCEPTILLADEPTGALDTKTSQDVMKLLLDLNNNEKTTIIIVTHDENVGEQCERTIRIQDGLVVSE